MRILKSLMTAIFLMAVSSLGFSQAVIVDSKPMGGVTVNESTSTQPAAITSAADQSQLYFQLQMLQQEVQELRGLVEQQAHEVRRLKQQQLDDYVDLDRRISQLSKGGVSAAQISPISTPSTVTAANADTPPLATSDVPKSSSPEAELASYDKAVRLIIKDKQLDEGAQAMQSYINDYPNGVYLSNAQYWMGQVAFVQGDLDDAKQWFNQLLQSNPNSQKAPEAKYKLGTVLHKLGENSEAKSLLTEVASSNSSASRLAQEYLKSNFQP